MFKKFMLGLLVISLLGLSGITGASAKKIVTWAIPSSPLVDKIVEEFEIDYPEIDIEVVDMRPVEYSLAAATGTLPDVIVLSWGEVIDKLMQSGLVIPLDNLIEKNNLDMTVFPEVVVDWSKFGGKIYGMPITASPRGTFVYNKDALKEAGIETPTEDLTWKEFREMARNLTQRDEDGNVIRYGVLDKYPFIDFFYLFGGRYVDDSRNPTKVMFAEDEGVAGLREFLSMVDEGICMPLPEFKASGGSKIKLFVNEKVAMVITGMWKNRGFREAEFDWDWQILPKVAGEKTANNLGVASYGITKGCKNVDEAFTFLTWAGYYGNYDLIRNEYWGVVCFVPPSKLAKEKFTEWAKDKQPDNWECMYHGFERGRIQYPFEGFADFELIKGKALKDICNQTKPLNTIYEAAEKAQKVLDSR